MNNTVLCHPSSGISLNVIVTIYKIKNQYEQILGYGYVQHIQQDGIIQISIICSLSEEFDELQLLSHISSNLSSIIIKTTSTIDTLKSINERS